MILRWLWNHRSCIPSVLGVSPSWLMLLVVFKSELGARLSKGNQYFLYQWCVESTACVMLGQAIWEMQGQWKCFCWALRTYHSGGRKTPTWNQQSHTGSSVLGSQVKLRLAEPSALTFNSCVIKNKSYHLSEPRNYFFKLEIINCLLQDYMQSRQHGPWSKTIESWL